MTIDINSPTFSVVLSAGYTQAQLTTFIKARFAAASFPTPSAETLGTPDRVGYEFDLNPSANYGKYRAIFENTLSGTTSTIRLRLGVVQNINFTGFTENTNTGANTTIGASFTLSNLNPLLVYAIPTTEKMFGLVFMENGSTFRGFLGIAYPTKESWYNEDLWAAALLVQPTAPNRFWLPYPNPSAASGSTAIVARTGIDTFATRNPVSNLAQVMTQPYITYHAWGIGGRFNADIGVSNNSGFLTNDISIKTAGVEEYWNMFCADNGIVFRSV